jgi:hypothetical protein
VHSGGALPGERNLVANKKIKDMTRKVHIGARIEPELRQTIEEAAERNGLTISEQVSSMLAQEEGIGLTTEEVRRIVREEISQKRVGQQSATETEVVALAMESTLPKHLRQEVLAMIEDALYRSDLPADNPLFLPHFLNLLADEANDYADAPPHRMRKLQEIPQLEEKVLWKIDDVIEEVLDEMEEDYPRESFLTTFADYLREAADLQYFEAREIRLSFSKEEWEQLDLMLSLLNKNRSAGKQFPDLQAFVKWKLGRALKDQANERLFGGYEYPKMAELGKTLQIMGVE